ncbi:MAG: hypothetical protein PHH71_00210 [Clostridia bacterium]|jgi:hypothetical protein|nr:hypothetical protein [Clostridia bacterium]MDD3231917.1 hypothetical protein [Clostridia bacterium]MDD3862483.1 hypothetical protein [Clostridia bacterium]MDD4408693.1 hypothetical protein [Clostridia bacterium]
MQLEDIRKLKEGFVDDGFLDSAINQQAEKDFKYLCSQTNYSIFDSLKGNFTLRTSDSKGRTIGEFLIIGHDTSTNIVKFPKNLIDVEKPNSYVAVVCYKNDKVLDVFVFDVANFKKVGLISMFKSYNKTNEYGIALNINSQKTKQYSFGYVLSKL